MSYINFKPWVGNKYATTGYMGMKILVLGESHYCIKELDDGGRCYPICHKEKMDDMCHNQTQDVVREAVYGYKGQGYLRCFVSFERAVAGKVLTQEEREDFWESVTFYNYIQYALSAPRTSPNPEFWGNSEKAFVELIEKYSPDKIIVWGARLYNGLPGMGGHEARFIVSDVDNANVWIYNINGKEIPALKMLHPSCPRGKNWPYWHTIISRFLGQQ